jgi:hypothetical protein
MDFQLTRTTIILLWLLSPAQAFVAYDCSSPEMVRQYSLIDAGGCNDQDQIGDRNIEKEWNGEIVQVKETRTHRVQKCLLIESRFSSHCGMFSHSGVAVYSRWRQQLRVEPQECRDAHHKKKITLNGQEFKITIGPAANFIQLFIAGSLNKTTLVCQGGPDGRVIQSNFEAFFTEEDGLLHEVTRVLTIPTNGPKAIEANVMDLSSIDSEFGTWIWKRPSQDCPESIVPLYHGPVKVRTNDSSNVVGAFAIIQNTNQTQVSQLSY